MNVDELLDTIEETLEEGASIPLSGGKRVVDVDKIRDYLDDVRLNIPTEIRQAKGIVNDRNQILGDAKNEAEGIVKKAEERAKVLVSDQEVLKQAEQRAAEVMTNAQNEARTMRQTVTDYCENMLKTTEETMTANAAQVKTVRLNLRQNAKSALNA